MWTIQWLGKQKPKSLDEILNSNKQKKNMKDDEMLAVVKNLNLVFGGEVK